MSENILPILIATDRAHEAIGLAIARALGEEFAAVQISTDHKRFVTDLELFKPALLVLAFNTIDRSERYLQSLRQPNSLAQLPACRTLILCGVDELRMAYDLCRNDHCDDFVLFWPKTEEMWPLRMAVRRALRQVAAERSGAPSVRDFAAQARRLPAPESVLETTLAQAQGNGTPEEAVPAPDPLRALHALAERCPPLVLVVDDDKFQHKLLAQLLATAKVDMAFATTVIGALAGLHRRRPDLILMDVSLPDIDGIAATRLLKSAQQFTAIPVIMITGVGGKSVVVESLKAGAADFVVKPLDKNVLLGKVRKLLYGRAAAA